MTVSTGDILKVVVSLVYPADAGINQNVFHALVSGAGSPWADGDIVDDALAWVADMYANLTTFLTDDVEGSQIQVYKWDTINLDWDEVGSDPWTFSPTQTAEYLPRAVAGLVLARTVDPDVLGKKYIPAMTENHVSNGLWIAAAMSAFIAYATDWVVGFTGGTSGASWNPGIWSPTQELLFDMSGTVVANIVPAYQRRRKRGVGI